MSEWWWYHEVTMTPHGALALVLQKWSDEGFFVASRSYADTYLWRLPLGEMRGMPLTMKEDHPMTDDHDGDGWGRA